MAPNVIRKGGGYRPDAYSYYPVIIIGAGISGVAMGCRLKEKLKFDQFRIFERQSGIGGTWWINRYPEVACDIPALFYSLSFAPNPRWTSFHPEGVEILQYLEDVCRKYQIVDKIQLDTAVSQACWLDDSTDGDGGGGVWEVTLTHLRHGFGDLSAEQRDAFVREHGADAAYLRTEKVRAKVLVSAVGGIVEPRAWPSDWPPLSTKTTSATGSAADKFAGAVFHSARWDASVDLAGKNVLVVGTGSSAVQFVPRLTQPPYSARRVTQLMRSPPWIVPRPAPPFGEAAWARWAPAVLGRLPFLALLFRALLFMLAEYDWRLFGTSSFSARQRRKYEAKLIEHMHKTAPEKYHAMLTPNYEVACKRRVFDAAWLPALNDPRIELTTQPVTAIQSHSVTLGPGSVYPPTTPEDPDKSDGSSSTATSTPLLPARRVPVDVIILANGFAVHRWLHPLDVRGRGGRRLHDVWAERGGPQAYLGAAVDGFPNFFIVWGPNTVTGHSSSLLAVENVVELVLRFVKPVVLDGTVATVEVKRDAELAWARDMQAASRKRVFSSGGCRSWYVDEKGWNSVTYPSTVHLVAGASSHLLMSSGKRLQQWVEKI